jgi:hypothetical protein
MAILKEFPLGSNGFKYVEDMSSAGGGLIKQVIGMAAAAGTVSAPLPEGITNENAVKFTMDFTVKSRDSNQW